MMRLASTALFLILLLGSHAFGEPYLAVREGLRCGTCHVNQTGGGQRTRMGTGYGAQDLPWKKEDLAGRKIPHYWSFLDDLISIGGDIRILNTSAFEEDNATNTFQTDKSNLYLYVNLIPDKLSFYLDESVAPGGAQAREIFALIKWHSRTWIKAGKFVLPYGIRLEDDGAFIREVTGFNFSNPDIGAEIGLQPGPWSFVASLTNGTAGSVDVNIDKQITGDISYTANRFRIGVSGSHNSGQPGDRSSAAIWSGLRVGPVILLGEVDWVRDKSDPNHQLSRIATHTELNYEIIDGWNVKAAYEYFDPDHSIDENERDRILIGVEPFLYPFLQFQVFYRFNQSIPQNKQQNADELSIRLHLYF